MGDKIMSNSEEKSPNRTDDFIFVKPEVGTIPRPVRGRGGYPPTEIFHDEDDSTRERQKKGIKYWLNEVITASRKKELRDESAYFVIDFKIKGDHPWINNLLKKLQLDLLTFLDKEKTKALVTSEIDILDRAVKSVEEFPKSYKNLVFDIRPVKLEEQIDKEIIDDEKWRRESKAVDIYIVPNIEIEKLTHYVNLAKKFLQSSTSEIQKILIDEYSKTGMLSVNTDYVTTSTLLQKSSFVYKVCATPKIGVQRTRKNKLKTASLGKIKKKKGDSKDNITNLYKVCVIDTGVNPISKLTKLISDRSCESELPDKDDHDDHGTAVAYLVAYGEGTTPRAQIISHKIISGSRKSNLVNAIANAIRLYLHKTRIFTCSLNFLQHNNSALYATRVIDRIVQTSNACVLFSAGNLLPIEIKSFIARGSIYPKYLKDSPVLHPSDAISVVAVGSYCKKSNSNRSFAPKDSPSPFTRCYSKNDLIYNSVKPEIVEHGGNLNNDFSWDHVGVNTFSANGSPSEEIGTSLSTPIVAGHLAEIYEKYESKIDNSETLKAIAYSSCEPTQNHPNFVGFGKPDCEDLFGSSYQSTKIVFEGELRLAHPNLRKTLLVNQVSVYVPAGVEKITLYLVHSDNYAIPTFPELNSYIEVIPDKPARESVPTPDLGNLNGREHVKRLVWKRKKGVKGIWTFTLVPHQIGIPYFFRKDVRLRYGGVIKLTTTRTRKSSLTEEVKRKLKGKMLT
jgi:hypothetical protein